MKIRHVYTVVREFSIREEEIGGEIEAFKGLKDEAGEYLYDGSVENEKTDVKMQIFDGKEWKGVVV